MFRLGHLIDELFERDTPLPAEQSLRFGGVTDQPIAFARSKETFVLANVIAPIQAHGREGKLGGIADGVDFTGGEDKVLRGLVLER